MAKTITIDTGAAWSTGVTVPQDGDIFRESNISDIWLKSFADRIGYLKTAVDDLETDKAELADANTWLDAQTIRPSGGGGQIALKLWRALLFVESSEDVNEALLAGVRSRIKRFTDASVTYTLDAEIGILPATLTGNRTLTLNSPQGGVRGRTLRLVRGGGASAHTFTIFDNIASANLAVFPASAAANEWLDLVYDDNSASGGWVVTGRSPNLTGVSTNV